MPLYVTSLFIMSPYVLSPDDTTSYGTSLLLYVRCTFLKSGFVRSVKRHNAMENNIVMFLIY
jgi:hypothetical protein